MNRNSIDRNQFLWGYRWDSPRMKLIWVFRGLSPCLLFNCKSPSDFLRTIRTPVELLWLSTQSKSIIFCAVSLLLILPCFQNSNHSLFSSTKFTVIENQTKFSAFCFWVITYVATAVDSSAKSVEKDEDHDDDDDSENAANNCVVLLVQFSILLQKNWS